MVAAKKVPPKVANPGKKATKKSAGAAARKIGKAIPAAAKGSASPGGY